MSTLNTAKTLMTFCIGIGAFVFVDQAIDGKRHVTHTITLSFSEVKP